MEIDFPTDWKLLPLESCISSIIDYRGKSPRKTKSGIPLITAKIVKNGRILPPEEYIASEDYDEWMRRGLPQPGDIIMTTEAPLGEVAQLDSRKIALAQRLITLRGKPNLLDNNYLKFAMMSEFVQAELKARATGTTVLGIRQSELRKIELPIPPFPEQRAIAHILGTLDDKIELNRHINETLEAIVRTIFKSWFVDFDPVRAKADGRKPAGMDAETAALFPDSFEETELGMVPKGWRMGHFDETIELIGGGTPKTSVPEYWDGDIPWFSIVDAPENSDVFVIDTEKKITKRGLKESSTRLLLKGTTIITARGTVGKCALVGNPMAMNQSCYGVRAKDQRGNYFNYFALRNLVSELQRSTHGSVFDTITSETFKTIQTAIVPIELTRIFDKKISLFMEQILCSLHESDTIITIRNLLLPKLLSGEIRLKDYEVIAEAK